MSAKIVFFGTKTFAEWSLDYAKTYNIEIDCFISNKSTKWGQMFGEGYEIKSPEYLRNQLDVVVIIATQGFSSIKKVASQLVNYGFVQGTNFFTSIENFIDKLTREYVNKTFAVSKPISQGTSKDRKYYVENSDGDKFFIQFADAYEYNRIKHQYIIVKECAFAGVPVANAVYFGMFNFLSCQGGGTYLITNWIEGGKNLYYNALDLSKDEMYQMGKEAAKLVKTLHRIDIPFPNAYLKRDYKAIIDENVELSNKYKAFYDTNLIKAEKIFINYVKENEHLVPPSEEHLIHGDFSLHNIMLDSRGNLTLIDFDEIRIGSIWDELGCSIRIGFLKSKIGVQHFHRGVLDQMLGDHISKEMWSLISFYLCVREIEMISKSILSSPNSLLARSRMCGLTLKMFNNMGNPIPSWYS